MLAKEDNSTNPEANDSVGNVKKLTPVVPSKGSPSARLQLILPSQSMERLTSIKETTEASSYAEVIRRSLRIYEGLLAEVGDGSRIVVRRADGSEECLSLSVVL